MTVPSLASRNDYTGTGSVSAYAYTFYCPGTVGKLVYTVDNSGNVTTLALGSGYTDAPNANGIGGTITLVAGSLPTGYTITIKRAVSSTQALSLRDQAPYKPSALEDALDYMALLGQRHDDDISRCLSVPLSDPPGESLVLPTIAQRANMALGFNSAGLPVAIAQGSGGGGGGGGGSSLPPHTHSVKLFGAIGDGASHPMSGAQAAVYNGLYHSIGLPTAVAGDENDWAACMACMLQCAIDGYDCYFPAGNYYVNRNLTLNWTPTPVTGQPQFPALERIYGDGMYLTQITANNLQTQYRAILELLGTNNTYAVDCVLEDMMVHALPNCHLLVYGLMVGDCNAFCKVNRFQTLCNNGLIMKIASSATYAQVGTEFQECNFYANYGQLYSSEAASLSYAVNANDVQGGASWDNVLFQNCVFGGLVETRATIVIFEDCQFFGSSRRSTADGHFHNSSLVVTIGSCTVKDCYFEDHYYGMVVTNSLSNINNISIINTHFSGINNDLTSPNPNIGIYVAVVPVGVAGFTVGPISIIGCQFKDPGYTVASIAAVGASVFDVANCDIDNPTTRELTRLYSYGTGMYQGATGLINIVDLKILDPSVTGLTSLGGATFANDVITSTQFTAPIHQSVRLGTGVGNAQAWGFNVQNPTAGDSFDFGMTSTTYTTGGGILWALNSMPFIYVPATGAGVMRMAVGVSASAYCELSTTQWSAIGMTLFSDTQIQCWQFNCPRYSTGAVAATSWGLSLSNAGASDSMELAWSSSAYTTGGSLPWVGNDCGYLYIPFGKSFTIGVSTISHTVSFSEATGLRVTGWPVAANYGLSVQNGASAALSITHSDAGQYVALSIGHTATLAANVTAINSVKITPVISAAHNVTEFAYFYLANPTLSGGATLTDGFVLELDAGLGTHRATVGSTTKATPGAVSGWLKHRVAGVAYYSPLYASTTT